MSEIEVKEMIDRQRRAKVRVDEMRELERSRIATGTPYMAVTMELSRPERSERHFFKHAIDADGDLVMVQSDVRFVESTDEFDDPRVRVEFPLETSPELVVRCLRKYAAMLEGPQGDAIASLGLGHEGLLSAVRLADGEAYFYRLADEIELRATGTER